MRAADPQLLHVTWKGTAGTARPNARAILIPLLVIASPHCRFIMCVMFTLSFLRARFLPAVCQPTFSSYPVVLFFAANGAGVLLRVSS